MCLRGAARNLKVFFYVLIEEMGGGRLFKTCSPTEPFIIIEISSDLSNIPPESSDDDHGDYTGEEEDHDHAVDDGEPVDLSICHL